MPLAAQLYTLRDHCQTAGDLAISLNKVHAIGYRAVQVSGIGPIAPAEVRRICDDAGLAICASHDGGDDLFNDTQAVIDRLGALGCAITAYPWPHRGFSGMAEVERLAADLDRAGAQFRRAGMTLCYHNHQIEFRKIAGRTILDWLYDLTAAANLQGEPDTYWVAHGGQDPAEWCRRLAGRLPIIHLKDLAINEQNQIAMAEIGNGNLDFPAIVAEAEASGCRWFVVEQDVCPADPFDSLAQSFRYCTETLELVA